ncbi:MAG: hypothetical protein KBG54_00030 [Oscillospiraceae bacterium]|nr:hypothetical protein [Oscillospiraceae bacterium]
MKRTRKTDYALCVCAAFLTLLQCVLFIFGQNAALAGNIGTLLFGGGLLLLAGSGKGLYRGTTLGAVMLLVLGLLPSFGFLLAALAWPVFAFGYFKNGSGKQKTLALVVMAAGAVQLVCSFLPLGQLWGGLVGAGIALCQLVFAVVLFQAGDDATKPSLQ